MTLRDVNAQAPVAPPQGGLVASPVVRLPPAAAARDLPLTRRSRWSPPPAVLGLTVVLGLATFTRTWGLTQVGYNSDEAVYAGQGASIAGNDDLLPYFPIFRAHPLLFQTLLSLVYKFWGVNDLGGRLASAVIGVLTVGLVFLLGRTLYGVRTGVVAATFMAVTPYHVVVTRQVLLDGLMTFFTTLTLYLLARYAKTGRGGWLTAAGAALGLAFLAKETAVLYLGSIYIFLAMASSLRVRVVHLVLAAATFVVLAAHYPISLAYSGKQSTGQSFLLWQLFRRPNHPWSFYLTDVPWALGPALVLVAIAGFVVLRGRGTWRETLMLSWIIVPTVFFTIWPVKGFQYLLPIAVPVCLLAARTLVYGPARMPLPPGWRRGRQHLRPAAHSTATVAVVASVLAATMLVPTWRQIQPSTSGVFLAGSGGLPGGRETGLWVRDNVPEGARLIAMGPSMANVLQFYGHRKAFGLSVSPNPLNRNPTYEPVRNPDAWLRNNEVHYLVWDSYSASRSPFFDRSLRRFIDRYRGRVVHMETVPVTTPGGAQVQKPVVIVYEVDP